MTHIIHGGTGTFAFYNTNGKVVDRAPGNFTFELVFDDAGTPTNLADDALGRIHQHRTVTAWVSETTLAIELDDGETRIVRRTTTQPVRSVKGQRPRTATSGS